MEIGPLPSQGLPVTMKASVVAREAHDVVAVQSAERHVAGRGRRVGSVVVAEWHACNRTESAHRPEHCKC